MMLVLLTINYIELQNFFFFWRNWTTKLSSNSKNHIFVLEAFWWGPKMPYMH